MAKRLKKMLALILAAATCFSTVTVGVQAKESADEPLYSVELIPGEETTAKRVVKDETGTYTYRIVADTSEVEVETKQTVSDFKGIKPALKFDRNSTADQKEQKVARELYTDNGHFHDPSTFTVTDAPAGYPWKYVGHGDYSGHYVSHVRVIYDRDADGDPKVDDDGNYIIKELQHVASGTTLYYGDELVTDPAGPFHYATGTRPQQFLLMNEEGDTAYGYCIDLETGAESDTWYALANLEDNNYYASLDAEEHVRGIVFNGYWGTESGTGSLASLKEALKEAVADEEVSVEQKVTLVNRKKFTEGYELQEGEYHYGSYVYWSLPTEKVVLTDAIVDQLTEGEALDAMQAAIWSWANGSNATMDGTDRAIVGDLYASSSQLSDSLNGKNDPEGAARTKALYEWLMQQKESRSSVIVNDKTFADEIVLNLYEEQYGTHEASLSFSISDYEAESGDDLTVQLTYVNAVGDEVTIEESLTGSDALEAEDGYYTIEGLQLAEGQSFEFTLNIFGEQQLQKNAYIFTSEGGTGASQTMVSMAEGTVQVDVTKTMDSAFTITEKFKPKDPVEEELGVKDDKRIDDQTNRYEVTIDVPGRDGDNRHDEVILMVDGSYSMDNEWPAMKEAINTIGATVLNGSGTTQLTLMAFGMGDNIVLEHVKDADALAAALGALPGNLLYGRSSTNCEAGFDGVANYIENHDETLKDAHVIFISDGNVNTDETLRAFDANWQTWTKFGALAVAQEAFAGTVMNGENLPKAFATVFGDRFAGATREEIVSSAFGGEVTDEEFIAFAEQLWTDVYAYSGLTRGFAYPVSVAERAFVKYDKEMGTYIQDLFYYTTYKSAYVTYGDRWTRTPIAADELAAMDEVASMYVVDYDSYTAWMDTGITSEKSTFVQSNGIAGLCEALAGALTNLAKTPFNDVVVTDYMSKWVNFIPGTEKVIDKNSDQVIWSAKDGWTEGVAKTTEMDPPVVWEVVDSNEYPDEFDKDTEINENGTIYKLTWYVKDGAMLRSDNYRLAYEVTVDTAEPGFKYDTDYPANGKTELTYKDENGEEQKNLIEVPDVYAEINSVPEIVIHKVDKQGNALTGAKFALYSGNELVGEYTVDQNGEISIKDLPVGSYKLVEIVAPEGYIAADYPMYFEIVKIDGEFEIECGEYEVEFPSTAYEISNHSMYPAIPQTFVLLDAEVAGDWTYPGEYNVGESNYRVVYCGDSTTGVVDGTRYVKTDLEECFDAETANKLRAIIANSYPYVSVEEMIAAAEAAGVADAKNLTRGDIIAAVQQAIWHFTNDVEEYTYRATYSVMNYPKWGKVFNDYTDELPDYLPKNTTATMQDAAGSARIDALYAYLLNLKPLTAEESEIYTFFYTAVDGKGASQSLIGGDRTNFYADGLDLYVKNTHEYEPPTVPEIVIHKVDKQGNALTGAKFALYSGDELVGEYTVDQNGEISIKDLPVGSYKLVETVVPEGYIGADYPVYFEIVQVGEEFKIESGEYEVEFPATAYEISNHITSVAIPQTFVLLNAEQVGDWTYSGEFSVGESDYRVVYCGDSETGVADGTRYVQTPLEDCFDAKTADQLRAIIANSYPYVSVEEMIAAAEAAGVADAQNLTRGDIIAAVQLAIWHFTNGIEDYSYTASYSVEAYPRWGKVFNDYSDELPEGLPVGTSTTRVVDAASDARIRALYNYLLALDPLSAEKSDIYTYFYTAVDGKDVSQSLIGGDHTDSYVNGLNIYVKNTAENRSVDLRIHKVDENDKPLAGAVFEARDAEGNVVATGTSDANGELTLTLEAGDHLLVETKAPAGYLTVSKAIEITVSEDLEISVKESGVAAYTDGVLKVVNHPPHAAVVLTIDMSGTMYRNKMDGKRYVDVAKAKAVEFAQQYAATAANNGKRMLSVVCFDTDAKVQQNWIDVSTAAGLKTAVAAINSIKVADNGKASSNQVCTNFDGGVILSRNLLKQSAVSDVDRCFTIILSDGAPTVTVNQDTDTVGTIKSSFWGNQLRADGSKYQNARNGGGWTHPAEVDRTWTYLKGLKELTCEYTVDGEEKEGIFIVGVGGLMNFKLFNDAVYGTSNGSRTSDVKKKPAAFNYVDALQGYSQAQILKLTTGDWMGILADRVGGTYESATNTKALQAEFTNILNAIKDTTTPAQ